MKFGTNGAYVCRNQLALSKIRNPPFPPLKGGPCPITRGLFELMDRFWWNLVRMVLMYAGIDWHCQKFEAPLSPPSQGGSMPPHRGTFRTNGPISMKFGMKGPYAWRNRLALWKSRIPLPPPSQGGGPCPPTGGLFELIDQFRWNLAKMVFTNVGMKWYCQIYQIVPVSHMKGGWGEHVSPKLRCIQESHSGSWCIPILFIDTWTLTNGIVRLSLFAPTWPWETCDYIVLSLLEINSLHSTIY